MKAKKHLFLIGLGMGDERLLTQQAKNALSEAQIIFGAERMLEIAGKGTEAKIYMPFYRPEEIFSYLNAHSEFSEAALVFSGDTGFFSGASLFLGRSSDWEISIFPGISSAIYFASKLHKSWQTWKMLSLHGSKCSIVEQVRKNPEVFFILSGSEDVRNVGRKLGDAIKNGILSEVKCYLGSNLSYDIEKILQIRPEEMAKFQEEDSAPTKSLFVLLVENENAKIQPLFPFLNDEDFIRAEKIPMTKKEIRRLSIMELGLSESSLVYDIGSGSGSVTVEAARIACEGQVIAVDCNEDALTLTQKNVEKFCLENVTFVQGSAPDCLKNEELPPPSHVFIGGSRGNLAEIISTVLHKNPSVRITANFVTLEGFCEMQKVLKELENPPLAENFSLPGIRDLEIKQIFVSRAEKAGDFRLMKSQNPVWIVSFSGNGGRI